MEGILCGVKSTEHAFSGACLDGVGVRSRCEIPGGNDVLEKKKRKPGKKSRSRGVFLVAGIRFQVVCFLFVTKKVCVGGGAVTRDFRYRSCREDYFEATRLHVTLDVALQICSRNSDCSLKSARLSIR